jgi:hypothetical protein
MEATWIGTPSCITNHCNCFVVLASAAFKSQCVPERLRKLMLSFICSGSGSTCSHAVHSLRFASEQHFMPLLPVKDLCCSLYEPVLQRLLVQVLISCPSDLRCSTFLSRAGEGNAASPLPCGEVGVCRDVNDKAKNSPKCVTRTDKCGNFDQPCCPGELHVYVCMVTVSCGSAQAGASNIIFNCFRMLLYLKSS